MNAIQLIAAERARQVEVEGWTPEHDDGHWGGEMANAASCYARTPDSRPDCPPEHWPWGRNWWKPTPHNRIRELMKTGALIVAEIERLQRASVSEKGAEQA